MKTILKNYLIWSEEHGAWWKPNKCGYTRSIFEAGRYRHAEALQIMKDANRDGKINELIIPWCQ